MELTLFFKLDIIRLFIAAPIPDDMGCTVKNNIGRYVMIFNGNCGTGMVPAPAAILFGTAGVGFIPVCGAMRRSHLIKE